MSDDERDRLLRNLEANVCLLVSENRRHGKSIAELTAKVEDLSRLIESHVRWEHGALGRQEEGP